MIKKIIDLVLKKSDSYSKIDCSLESAKTYVFQRFSTSALRSASFNDFAKTFDNVIKNKPYSVSEYVVSYKKHVDYFVFYIEGSLYIVSVPQEIRMKIYQLIETACYLQEVNNINKIVENIPDKVKELFPDIDLVENSDQK